MYSLDNAPLAWPEAKKWMWNYCIYLGPFTNFRGEKFDLGIYLSPHGSNEPNSKASAAIVYGPNDGDYMSGPLYTTTPSGRMKGFTSDVYQATYHRAKALRLMR